MIVNFNNVEFDKAFGTSKQLPASTLPEVAFAGRSNVGKSSVINSVLNRKQFARVGAEPGIGAGVDAGAGMDVGKVNQKVTTRPLQSWATM